MRFEQTCAIIITMFRNTISYWRNMTPNQIERVQLVIEAANVARDAMRELADNAGDVPEWNKGGYAYKACHQLDRAINRFDN